MSDLLSRLLAFPPHPPPPQPLSDTAYDKQIRSLVSYLNGVPTPKLVGGVPEGGDLLDILDPSLHTLPYLWTLIAHAQAYAQASRSKIQSDNVPKELLPDGALWPRLLVFLEQFDPIQVRYAGQEFRDVINYLVRATTQASQPLLAVPPLRTAILRLDPSSSTFTSTHLLFVQVCLRAKAFSSALEILDRRIFHLPALGHDKAMVQKGSGLLCAQYDSSASYISGGSGLTSKLTYRDHLRYFLYGAMTYMALKQWREALFFLEIVVVTPTSNNVTSMIQVEAYKKWVLVGLILHGRHLPMPKTTSQQNAKNYRAIARPYDALAEKFNTGSAPKLAAEIEAGQNIWAADRNTGLVLQVVAARRRFSVLKLKTTFAALSIPQIASRTSPDPSDLVETESYVASLIASGDLKGTLSQPANPEHPATLRFMTTSGETFGTEDALQTDLASQSNDLALIMRHLQQDHGRIELSNEYVDYLRRMKKSREAQNGQGAEGTASGVQEDFDEDMMADLN